MATPISLTRTTLSNPTSSPASTSSPGSVVILHLPPNNQDVTVTLNISSNNRDVTATATMISNLVDCLRCKKQKTADEMLYFHQECKKGICLICLPNGQLKCTTCSKDIITREAEFAALKRINARNPYDETYDDCCVGCVLQ